jgi:hypothetical protein
MILKFPRGSGANRPAIVATPRTQKLLKDSIFDDDEDDL